MRVPFNILSPRGVQARVLFVAVEDLQLMVPLPGGDVDSVHELVGERLVVLQPGHGDGLLRLAQGAFEEGVLARWGVTSSLRESSY